MTASSLAACEPPSVESTKAGTERYISPFRYPGGKTWLIPIISKRLEALPATPRCLIDPYLGGASVPLSVLRKGLVERVALAEIDPSVCAVWECIFGPENDQLCKRIEAFMISRESVKMELQQDTSSLVDRAFRTLLQNRTSHGGIMAPGSQLLKKGERGRGVSSRWYPATLVTRLQLIKAMQAKIEFTQGDAFPLIDQYIDSPDAVFFVDPPYTAGSGKRAGRRLYRHSEINHEQLFSKLSKAAGSVLMTYDDCPDVEDMARSYGFSMERVPMRNTHHDKKSELLISKAAR